MVDFAVHRDQRHHGRVAAVAAGLLLLLAGTEYPNHEVRDAASYRAGYAAASSAPRQRLGAVADSQANRPFCDALFERASYTTGFGSLNEHDFHAGCAQAVRDAIE